MAWFAKKTHIAAIGRTFDSKAEAGRALVLWDRQQKGEIENLEFQVKYPFVVNGVKVGSYTADFRYWEDGQMVVEDVKANGYRTQQYQLRKRLLRALYAVEIREVAA